MRDWFWAWIIAAAIIAVVATATRDRYTAPWVAGCLVAAGLEALRVHPGWQWTALLLVSGAIFVAFNRIPKYVGRHAKGRAAR